MTAEYIYPRDIINKEKPEVKRKRLKKKKNHLLKMRIVQNWPMIRGHNSV